jgi:hypothetical protein
MAAFRCTVWRIAAVAVLLSAGGLRAEEYFVGAPRSGFWHKKIVYDVVDKRPIWFGGTLKCENAFPVTRASQEQEFGVSVVLKYADGSESWKPFARWNPGSHGWETAQSVYWPKKPVASATLRVCANPGPGTSSYRDIFIRREDPGLSIERWRRITDRPFADRDYLFVSFPRPYDWRSEAPGGLAASGRGDKRAFVPIPPRSGGKARLVLSCDGREETKTIEYPVSQLPPSPVRPGCVRVWTEDSMRAVTPFTFPAENASVDLRLAVARRGSASAQLLITTAEGESLEGVTLSVGSPVSARGKVLSGTIAWQRIGYVRRHPDAILHPLAPDREIRWLPDPLLPAAPMRVRPGSTQGAWVTVSVAPDAEAGLYRSKVTLAAAGRTLASVPLAVRVLPFAQPEIFGSSAIHALYESHVLNLYGKRGEEMLERVYDMVLDHRLNPDGCGNRWHDPIPIEKLKKWRSRGMRFTSAMALNVKAARADTVWVPHPTVEQTNDSRFYEGIRDRLRPYMAQLRANALADCVYVYGFDEAMDPLFPGIGAFWRRFKADFPDVPVMTTAFMYRRRAEGKKVDDWTVTDWHCPGMAYWRKNLSDELRSQGKQAWWYICCSPCYPRLNVGIEHPPLEGRLLSWQQYAENCDGVFNWGINYWHRRRLTDDSDVFLHEWNFGAGMSGMTGDGIMIYPGQTGPLPSIRLANVRDGVQDYEWMKLAEKNAGREAVEKIVREIVPDQTGIVREAARLHAARMALIRLNSSSVKTK